MARPRGNQLSADPPSIGPEKGINLLEEQITKGQDLLGSEPVTKDDYDSWMLLTRNFRKGVRVRFPQRFERNESWQI